MFKKLFVLSFLSLAGANTYAGASEFLNCPIGDAVAAINFSTQTRADVRNPKSTMLTLEIVSQDDRQEPQIYRATLSMKDKAAIANGQKIVVLMKSKESFEFGGDTSRSSLVAFNSGEDGMTLISDHGGVLKSKCIPAKN